MKVFYFCMCVVVFSMSANASQMTAIDIKPLVEQYQQENKLVSLGAILIVDGDIQAIAATGERRRKKGLQVSTDDAWHIGSITKSFTATLIARLIEQGKLDWDSNIAEFLPQNIEIHPDWQRVTIQQLLSHTSGAKANFSKRVHSRFPPPGLKRKQARLDAVSGILKKKPKSEPGTEFVYSNVGYTLAGVVAEQITGETWEDLVTKEVFEPLNLKGAGFGPPARNAPPDTQPSGHLALMGILQKVIKETDNTPIIGPAGLLHLTLTDLALYANEHLQGEQGMGQLLTQASYERLHTPVLNHYALGWAVDESYQHQLGKLIWHNGSNRSWYAMVFLIPEHNAAVAFVTNDGRIKKADKAMRDLLSDLAPLILKDE